MDAQEAPLGKPVGRRIFLGLLGAGAAGLVFTEWGFRDDNVDPATVAEAVPLGSMDIDQREASEGYHPNIVTSERFRYYSVGYIPDYHPLTWRLRVDGEGIDHHISMTLDQLKAYPNTALKATFRCVTGWRVQDNLWRGVRVRDVIDTLGRNGKAKFVTFYSGDGVYTESLTMGQARSNNAILCWELDGAPLIKEQGLPLRLIYPDMYGYKNIKWVTRVEVKGNRDVGFWEQNGWDIDAYVYNPPQFNG